MAGGLSMALKVDGTIKGQKFEGSVGYIDDKVCVAGKLILGNGGALSALSVVGDDVQAFAKDNLQNTLSNADSSIELVYADSLTSLSLNTKELSFIAAVKGGTALFALKLSIKEKVEGDGLFNKILDVIKLVEDFFGIEELLIVYRTGMDLKLNDVMKKVPSLAKTNALSTTDTKVSSPPDLNGCNLILSEKFVFQGKDSVFTEAMSQLFGIKSLDMFIGVSNDFNTFIGMFALPNISNSILTAKDIYIKFGKNGQDISFQVRGSIILNILKDVTFTINCSMGMGSFLLAASAEMKKPLTLIGDFKIGDTALLIGFDKGALTCGLLTTLHLRKLSFFGAVIVKIYEEVPTIQMLSAAVTDLTIPSLIENFTGISVPGIEFFDVIKIEGFDFYIKNRFSQAALKDVNNAVEFFNNNVNETGLKLDSAQCKLSQWGDKTELLDKQRMRHYVIDKDGKLSLACQFYTSFEPYTITMGSYVISPGMFICGTLQIFSFKLKVFFSVSPTDGILAFLHVEEVDLGFLKLESSSYSARENNKISLPDKSVIHQFVRKDARGPILFFSANKNDCSFYLDGKLSLFNIFQVDTRIVYYQRYISINARSSILGIFTCELALKVDYTSASNLNFQFKFVVDTSGLEKLFRQVQDTLNRVIESYKEKVKSATRKIDEAQNKVNELNNQINYYNRKIDECKRKISEASSCKKVAVGIAEGAKITGYEIAKAGLYVALGTATAVLQAAKGLLNLSAKIGSAVVSAINAVISGVLNLFYIRRFEIMAAASADVQAFKVAIEFVALGKTYSISKSIQHEDFKNNAINSLSSSMNGEMKNDLDNIEKNMRSNKSKFKLEKVPVEVHQRRIAEGIDQIERTKALLGELQERYFEEFGQLLDSSEYIDNSIASVIDTTSTSLNITSNMIDRNAVQDIINQVNESVNNNEEKAEGVRFRDDEIKKVNVALNGLKDVINLTDTCEKSINILKERKDDVENNMESLRTRARRTVPYAARKGEYRCSMTKVIDDTERLLMDKFADRRSNYYINYAKESKILQMIDMARKQYGGEIPQDILNTRSRIRNNNYKERL